MNTATATSFERICWAGAALLAAALLHSVYVVPLGPLPLTVISGLVLLAVIKPSSALLVLAAVGPLAPSLFWITGPRYDTRFEEILVLAYTVGAAAHLAARPARGALPTVFRWTVWLLILTALASTVVVFAGLAATDPSVSMWGYAARLAGSEYLQQPHALFRALLLVEGLGLALICAELCARDPRPRSTAVVGALVAAGTLVGVLTIVRLVSIAVARDDPWTTMITLIAQFRVSAVHPDLNAAGSYFALLLCAAVGLTRRRWVLMSTVPLMVCGLWTSGSRAALAACVIAATAVAIQQRSVRLHRRLAAAGAIALAVILVVGIAWYPEGRNEGLKAAAAFRIQIGKAAMYAVADAPVFGIGAGRFYDESMRYVAASRHSETPLHVGSLENAHNYFLQVAAELGLLGLGLFLTLLASALGKPIQSMVERRLRWAIVAGLVVYLATCLVGHPLLVAGTAYPFWLLLGVAACARGRVPPSAPQWQWAGAAVVVMVVASLPVRAISATRSANLEHAGVGLSMWQRDNEGIRFRWGGGRSALYVPADATAVKIPLRHGGQGPAIIDVRIFIAGREANRVRVEAGGDWTIVRLLVPPGEGARFTAVDLLATSPDSLEPLDIVSTDGSGALMIGRIEPERSRY